MGRPNKYETYVKSRFDEIENWVKLGATEKEIAKRLQVHKSTFIKYKNKYSELDELIKRARKVPVEEIKAAMFKRAVGFEYTETKTITQEIKLPDDLSKALEEIGFDSKNSGKPILIKTENTKKYVVPDVAAGLVLLQHWDKDEKGKTKWSRDPAQLELRKEELKFKKKQAENDNW